MPIAEQDMTDTVELLRLAEHWEQVGYPLKAEDLRRRVRRQVYAEIRAEGTRFESVVEEAHSRYERLMAAAGLSPQRRP